MFRGTQKTSRRYATNGTTLFSLTCRYGFPQVWNQVHDPTTRQSARGKYTF